MGVTPLAPQGDAEIDTGGISAGFDAWTRVEKPADAGVSGNVPRNSIDGCCRSEFGSVNACSPQLVWGELQAFLLFSALFSR